MGKRAAGDHHGFGQADRVVVGHRRAAYRRAVLAVAHAGRPGQGLQNIGVGQMQAGQSQQQQDRGDGQAGQAVQVVEQAHPAFAVADPEPPAHGVQTRPPEVKPAEDRCRQRQAEQAHHPRAEQAELQVGVQVFDPGGKRVAPEAAGDHLGGVGVHRDHQRRVQLAEGFMGLFIPRGHHALRRAGHFQHPFAVAVGMHRPHRRHDLVQRLVFACGLADG